MHILPVLEPASPQARVIVSLFWAILIACGVILAIVTGAVVYCLVRFRGRAGAAEPRQLMGSKPLEALWTVGPILTIVWMFMLTARAVHRSDPVPRQRAPDLVVVGHQWWWEVRYPKTGAVTANEIHIPTGRRLLVRLEAADVIHDFWVPELTRKMDMVPGHPNQVWLEADRPGAYGGTCAEYCGTEHAWMRFVVIAQTPAQFETWLQQEAQPAPAPTGDKATGAHLFQTMTCANCHAIRGLSAGVSFAPDLTHLGSRHTLAAGLLPNALTNLVAWLRNPQALKPGVLMPNLHLSAVQATELATYLESLK
jgi:cytochrome c oxidase subunit II